MPIGAAIKIAIKVTLKLPTTSGIIPNFGCDEIGSQVDEKILSQIDLFSSLDELSTGELELLLFRVSIAIFSSP